MKHPTLGDLLAMAKMSPFELDWDVLDDPAMSDELVTAAESAKAGIISDELIYMRLIHGEDVLQYYPLTNTFKPMSEDKREEQAICFAERLLDRYRVTYAGRTYEEITKTLTNA